MTDFYVMEPNRSLLFGEGQTWSMQIRDGTGDLVDPASQSVTADVYDSGNTQLVTAGAAVRTGVGLYYYTYVIPGAGPAGIWRMDFNYTLSGNAHKYSRKFGVDQIEVVDYTDTPATITVSWMRGYLMQISQSLLPDSTLAMEIVAQSLYIDQVKSPLANSDVVIWAKIFRIAHAAYALYTANHERTMTEEDNINNENMVRTLETKAIEFEILAKTGDTAGIDFTMNTIAAVYGKSVSSTLPGGGNTEVN
jgi:hypothetical protein